MEPFGINAANDNPSGLGAFEFNLRFPGQYFDKETNNHYNYFRDYDSSIGRYVQSDPIGLNGGLNTFAYVDSDPVGAFDREGLTKVTPPRPTPNWASMLEQWKKTPQQSVPKKEIPKIKDDAPSWAKGKRPTNEQTPADFAKKLLDDKYGPGNYKKGPASEYSQIKKWAETHFNRTPKPQPPADGFGPFDWDPFLEPWRGNPWERDLFCGI